jgi:hypothetical protein
VRQQIIPVTKATGMNYLNIDILVLIEKKWFNLLMIFIWKKRCDQVCYYYKFIWWFFWHGANKLIVLSNRQCMNIFFSCGCIMNSPSVPGIDSKIVEVDF